MEKYVDHIRLYDVFISGPIYIILSIFVFELSKIKKNYIFLGIFVLLTGIMTIIFNLHNWLLIDKKKLKKKIIPWADPKEGKYQWHRLFNLIIMYPLLFYANYITINKPKLLTILIYIMIICGFLFNLYWFLRLSTRK